MELDGIMSIQNGDAVALHGVDSAWQQTGYDGSGNHGCHHRHRH